MEKKRVRFEKDNFLIEGDVYLLDANSQHGYNCGISIFIPKNCQQNTTLLMHSCNTGNNVPIHLSEANDIAKRSTYEKPNHGMWLGYDLQMPVMIPLIPRMQGYYTQALGSKVWHNDVSGLIANQERRRPENVLSFAEIRDIKEQCRDIPNQVACMITEAKNFLRSLGYQIDEKIIAEGYSAGSRFANCFTALYPNLVKACICGGNSGLGILPITEYQGQQLKYPLGVADVPAFDFEAFRQIPQLYYIGTEDYNDPAMLDTTYQQDGRLQPRYKENFTQEEIEQIYTLLGENPQVRFNNNEALYSELGINATFRRFPGNHNTVTQQKDGDIIVTNECIKDFIRGVLQEELDFNDTYQP